MKILLISTYRYLWQLLKLTLDSDDVELSRGMREGFDRILYDLDSADCAVPDVAYTLSRRLPATLCVPFSEGEIKGVLQSRSTSRLRVKESTSQAILDGVKIPLTDTELKLLSALIRRSGFVSQKELLLKVFGEGKSAGLLTLYIHYLREKLEVHGEKIIISSRSEGYKISERFKGGEGDLQAD